MLLRRKREYGFASREGRELKARKIEAIVADFLHRKTLEGCQILDIGTGSGHIAAYFAAHNQVTSVDIVDQRTRPVPHRFDFVRAHAERLPFTAGTFDVVLSNHVLAYLAEPQQHFHEIARVLAPRGVAYLATPNRYFPLEPHIALPGVHWLPPRGYRWLMGCVTGHAEVQLVPGYLQLTRWITAAGLTIQDYTMRVLRQPEQFAMPTLRPLVLPEACRYLVPTCLWLLCR